MNVRVATQQPTEILEQNKGIVKSIVITINVEKDTHGEWMIVHPKETYKIK